MNTMIPITPKDPNGPLRVVMIGRVSTLHQDTENIPASYKVAEDFLAGVYHGPMDVRQLGEQASGMLADRDTIREAEEFIASGLCDLVIVEDLSRIHRNPRYQWAFVQDCVDHQTRVICIADNLDTADPNWEIMMHTAALRHGLTVPDTRRRVRRTATHAFDHGGMVQKTRFGYRKLTKEEAASGQFGSKGLRIARVDQCTRFIREMRTRIMQGETYDAVAIWLKDERVEPGPYAKSRQWTGRLVEALLRDPILSGTRTFRDVLYERVFKTGKHRRTRNPNEPETKHYLELAHLTVEEHTELLAVMDARKGDRDYPKGPENPLWNRPRSHSFWPGQHAICGCCGGRMYRWGKYLKCQNALSKGPRTCWNHVQVGCSAVLTKVIPWILNTLDAFPDFRERMAQAAYEEYKRQSGRAERGLASLEKQITELGREAENLAKAIAKGGRYDALLKQLSVTEKSLKEAKDERTRLLSMWNDDRFPSFEDVARQLHAAIDGLAVTSFEFANLLRRLMPQFTIVPVQALDRPTVRPRAYLTLSMAVWAKEAAPPPDVTAVIDLFDPPLHIRAIKDCRAARQETSEATLRDISVRVGLNYMAVKRAFDYARLMEKEGTTDPYRQLTERPNEASRWQSRRPTTKRESA